MGTQGTAKSCKQSDAHKGISESVDYIQHLADEEFYGTLELRFEAGNIVHLTEHKSMKPYLLKTPDKLRSSYEKHSEKEE
jgi:hypothetical protein